MLHATLVKMQMKQKEIKNATFPDIWDALPFEKRGEVMRYLVASLRVTSQAIYNWASGRRHPRYPYRKGIAAGLAKVTGERYNPDTLFPAS